MVELIVYEGIDGVGKTYMCKKLAKKNNWVYVKTPSRAMYKIKCKGEMELLARYGTALLLNANKIQKLLISGKTVICDRYYGTYLVDCALLGVSSDRLFDIVLPKPTKVIHLVADWEVVIERLKKKKILSEFEKKIISDKKAYEKVVKEFKKLGYEEQTNNGK